MRRNIRTLVQLSAIWDQTSAILAETSAVFQIISANRTNKVLAKKQIQRVTVISTPKKTKIISYTDLKYYLILLLYFQLIQQDF